MFRYAALALLFVAGGCRLQFGQWQGAPPRASDQVRIALATNDERVRAAIEASWRRDPKIEISPVVLEQVDPACATYECTTDIAKGCHWARTKGLDYFADGRLSSASSSEFKCTKRDGSIFDKNEGDCIEGHEINQRSSATFTVTTYDVHECKPISSLSSELRAYTSGNAAEDVQEVTGEALAKGDLGLPTFPAQVTLDGSARITGDEPGSYAVFRNRKYIGTMLVDDVSAPGKMLTCCHEPAVGDALVRRGRVTQISLDPSATLTQLSVAGEQRIAGGGGLNLRYYKMDGGLEVTVSGESITAGDGHGGAGLVLGTVGWGFRPNAALRLSAAAGGGLLYATQSRMDMFAYAVEPVAWLGGRAIFTPVPYVYVGADVGYAVSGETESWEGEGRALAEPMALRAPMVRIFAGLSQ